MEGQDFDQITRRLAEAGSRRTALKRLGLGTLAGVFGVRAVDAEAKKRSGKGAGKSDKGQGKAKVAICHKPGTPAEKTLHVPQSAVAGHLGHGDSEGECGALADCTTNADLCTTCQVCDTEAKICVPKCAPGEECDLTDGTCSGGGGGCPGGCTENATCVDGVCICDEGFKPDPGTGACIPDDTGECPGKCFFIRAREACFTCPKGSKATAQGTCRCQHKARECQDLFGGKRVKPVRCQNG